MMDFPLSFGSSALLIIENLNINNDNNANIFEVLNPLQRTCYENHHLIFFNFPSIAESVMVPVAFKCLVILQATILCFKIIS